MKPFSTGSEMKLARKPSRRTPGDQRGEPGGDRERGGERHERVRAVGDVRDRGGGEGRGRRHRPDDQVARAAEGGVEDQRARRGVEADDRRDAGDRRVGERLRDEHRPDRQPGDDVAAQPAPVVARAPR